jgi:hypothetical protein
VAGGVFMELPKFSRADILIDLVLRGAHPGVETPVTPVGPDVLDGGGVEDCGVGACDGLWGAPG